MALVCARQMFLGESAGHSTFLGDDVFEQLAGPPFGDHLLPNEGLQGRGEELACDSEISCAVAE